MRIGQRIEITGDFWTPGRQDQARSGTLTIENDGSVFLETTGLIGDESVKLFDHSFERIEGSDDSGGMIVLQECVSAVETINIMATEKMRFRYRARLATCGLREIGEAEPTYSCVTFALDNLHAWLNADPFHRESISSDPVIRYTTPPSIRFGLCDGFWLETRCTPLFSGGPDECRVKHDVSLQIKSDAPHPFEEFSNKLFRVHQLFCILMGKTVSLTHISAVPDAHNSSDDLARFTIHKFYYASSPYTISAPKINHWDVVLNCNQIVKNYDDIFARWLALSDNCSAAMGQYLLAGTDGYRYAASKFLALAQALETFHRETNSETRINTEDFAELKKSLHAVCPEEYKKLLHDALSHANQLTLAQRLDSLTAPFRSSIGGTDATAELCKRIKDSRNYYTHLDSKFRNRAAKGQELVALYAKMRVVFELNLLRLLAVPVEELINQPGPLKNKVDLFSAMQKVEK